MCRGRSMPCRFVLLLVVLGISALITAPAWAQDAVIIDHKCTKLEAVPDYWVEQAKLTFFGSYGHTSHGSQIVTGMNLINTADGGPGGTGYNCPSCNDYECGTCFYDFCDDYYYYRYGTGNDPAPAGTLSFFNTRMGGDLGHNGDLTWEATTRSHLGGYGSSRNLIMWSWCGGVSDNTEAGINIYLNAMNQLEIDYPNVTFIYMTGHLDGGGETGNLHIRNNQIRAYCRDNDKVLFDFADIESYNPDWDYFLDLGATDSCAYSGGNWATQWCDAHAGSELCTACTDCAHSHCLNCNLKGRAFWWMMARLAGWEGPAQVDYDRDGDVDLTDFGAFSSCIAGPGAAPNPPLPPPPTAADCLDAFDTDGDLDVDLDDFKIFQAGYTAT